MFFLWVVRRSTPVGIALLQLPCRPCEKSTEHVLYRVTDSIVIFVRLFDVGSVFSLRCDACWATFDITKDEAAWLADPAADLSGYRPHSSRRAAPGARQRGVL